MRRRFCNQLALDLDHGKPRPLQPAPEELLKALADLLLEALGSQTNAIPTEREGRDARQDQL
jgi:hypothetical protein